MSAVLSTSLGLSGPVGFCLRPKRAASRPHAAHTHHQYGQSLPAMALSAVTLLALGLATIELAHWFSVRQVVSLALIEAARAGAVSHAQPQAIADAFTTALLPLAPAGHAQPPQARLQARLNRTQGQLQAPPWQIRITSPHPQAFTDFGVSGKAPPGVPYNTVIDNDYLAEQHQRHLTQGWPQGRGPLSAQTIHEANTLSLTLVFPHQPALAGVRSLLTLLPADTSTYAGHALRQGLLPLKRKVSLTMQSHAALWPSLANDTVLNGLTGDYLVPPPPSACPGCHTTPPGPASPDHILPVPGATPVYPLPFIPGSVASPDLPSPQPDGVDTEHLPPDPDLCGVALCCAD